MLKVLHIFFVFLAMGVVMQMVLHIYVYFIQSQRQRLLKTKQDVWQPPQELDSEVNIANESSLSFILNNKQRCRGEFEQNPSLFIFVESAVDDFERRRVWRSRMPFFQTSGDKRVAFMFILALPKDNLPQTIQKKILNESRLYGDILQLNYTDTYTTLVLKTVAGMKWVVQYCANAHFILKTDVDVFVNVHAVLDYLSELGDEEKKYFYGGEVCPTDYVYRPDGKGPQKWAVPRSVYPYQRYPMYILGYGILMANHTVVRFLAYEPYIKYFVFEDVYIGMLAKASNVNTTSVEGLTQNGQGLSFKFDYCKVKSYKVIHNFRDTKQLKFFWDDFERLTKLKPKCK